MKNVKGNSLNDEQVLKLLSKEKSIFFTDLRDLFNKKKKSRIQDGNGNQQKTKRGNQGDIRARAPRRIPDG